MLRDKNTQFSATVKSCFGGERLSLLVGHGRDARASVGIFNQVEMSISILEIENVRRSWIFRFNLCQ